MKDIMAHRKAENYLNITPYVLKEGKQLNETFMYLTLN